MDQKSLITLEFNKILQRLAEHTQFSAGRKLAETLHPTTNPVEAELWQAQTAEAVQLLEEHPNVTVGGARDVRQAVENAFRGITLQPPTLQEIRSTLEGARALRRRLHKLADEVPHLADIADLIEECPGIIAAVNETLDERDQVRDSASEKLARVRQQQERIHGRIHDKLQGILNGNLNRHLQEPIITTRNGRYVIPLKTESRGRIKGIVHDQSGSGATLWLEPINTVELNNEYRSLQVEEKDEIERILAALTAKVAEQGDSIQRVVERLAELDLIFARARYAIELDAVAPIFTEWREWEAPKPPKHANERAKWTPPPPTLHPGSTVWIKGARHPLLDPHSVVPTDLTLDEETFIVLITGPNTGGKTVSLKTTGLMVLMAQAGLHLPAVEARLTVFENVFADIGDEQSIEQSLSTFSAHMTNIVRVLEQVDDNDLVLLDELGSGTDPSEGAALAQSIVSYLRDKGATTFVATHYPELKVYASQTKGATNASLLFDVDTLSPTYEMSIGIPGRSNAFAIARRLGLSDTVLDEAMSLIGAGSREAEDMLDSIYALREKMESEEAGTRLALRQAEGKRSELEQQLENIEEERRQILGEARQEAEAELAKVRDEIQRVRRGMRDAESFNRLKKLGKEIEETAEGMSLPKGEKPIFPTRSASSPPPQDLAEGDIVKVISLNTRGEVLEKLNKKEYLIAVGQLHMRAKLDDLELKERANEVEEEEKPEEGVFVSRKDSPDLELDLRGKRVAEGLSDLTSYIDSAFLSRMPWVRIIHGKGTGRLRQAVRKSLSQNQHVDSWEEGKDGEGGAGVTIAHLVEHD